MKNYHQPVEEPTEEELEELRQHKRNSRHERHQVKQYLQRCLRTEDFEVDDLELN
jgi:hypothetical protein